MVGFSSKGFIQQFEQTIDAIGIWMLYTRSDHRFRCIDCYSPTEGSSPSSCSECYGTGYKVELERWLVFYTNSIRRAADLASPTNITGVNPNHTDFIFSKRQNVPVVGDIFFLVGWDKERDRVSSGGRPVRVDQALKVTYVEPHIAGETIYYLAHCASADPSKKVYESIVKSAPIVRTRR